MEAYIEFTMFSFLNYKEMIWPDGLEAVKLSNWLAIALVICTVILPVFLFFWMCFNRKNWGEEVFQAKYGSYLDGNDNEKPEKQWIILITVSIFFLRRMLLCLTLVFWNEFLWG